jgi:hypothetical protein
MEVRDAVEADAERLAELTDQSADVMRNLVHDRTVRVAIDPDGPPSGNADEDREGRVVGFVSFDAGNGLVHITQLEGTEPACQRLLDEPTRFARSEGMTVELLVAHDAEAKHTVAEAAGFRDEGAGPRFGDTPTVRYRFEPTAVEQ